MIHIAAGHQPGCPSFPVSLSLVAVFPHAVRLLLFNHVSENLLTMCFIRPSFVILMLVFFCARFSASQQSEQYERGTIVAVVRHPAAPNQEPGSVTYDVSVRVRDTIYVCLY